MTVIPRLRAVLDDDLDAVARIVTDSLAAADQTAVITAEELSEEWTPPYCDRMADVVVADIDGKPVGVTWTYLLPSEENEIRCHVFGHVAPTWRRRGVGSALLDWGLSRGRDLLAACDDSLPRVLRVSVLENNHGLSALLGSRGLAPVRWFTELLRPLHEDLPDLDPPRGVDIVAWDSSRSGEALAVRNVAFRDHWGSTPMLPEGWRQLVDGYGACPPASRMATRDGQVVGFLVAHRYPVDDDAIGMRIGWLQHIGVHPDERRRGIASSLIAASLRAHRDEGCTHAAVDVDADSPTGAHRLYESLGFTRWRGSATWEVRMP